MTSLSDPKPKVLVTDDNINLTMEDETADNPALTTPASHQLSNGHISDHHHEAKSDPKTVPRRSVVVSKYDRSWRRIVRNFSPS